MALKIVGVICVTIGFVAFFWTLLIAGLNAETQETERLRVCVESGGSWNQGQGDCTHP